MNFVSFLVALGTTVVAVNASVLQKHNQTLESPSENDGSLLTPNGLSFIGSGYNLIKGNPDGQDISNGGVDPGLLPAKRILEISFVENRKSDNNKYRVPDQIRFAPRDSCASQKTHDVISSSLAYQEQLSVSVKAEVEYEGGLWKAAFAASASYENMNKGTSSQKNVFFEERTVCLKGNAEYFFDKALTGQFSTSEAFAAAVCNLPEAYNQKTYVDFINEWGTHVLMGADLGTKEIKRRKSSSSEFTEYALTNYAGSVSASGGYGGLSASLTVDVKSLSESMKEGSKFGCSETTFKIGGANMPEPISIRLKSILRMFDTRLYGKIDKNKVSCDFSATVLEKKKNNVLTILKLYPEVLSVDYPKAKNVTVTLSWPKGTYGLPMPNKNPELDNCPANTDFTWKTGCIYQDTEDEDPNNFACPAADNHLGMIVGNDAKQVFCMKTEYTPSHLSWPRGTYCIVKKGNCPKGFTEGSILWEDEKNRNRNHQKGVVPDGDLIKPKRPKTSTVIDFCCREDAFAANPIYLPTEKPFLLYKGKKGVCQQVHGMDVELEYFRFDLDDDYDDNPETFGPQVPFGWFEVNIRLFYCYYSPKTMPVP